MTKMILDDSLKSRLTNLDREIEFCDEAGHTVGHFLPADRYTELLYAWTQSQVSKDEYARAKAEFSDEEIERARKERGGMSTGEVLAYLDQVPQPVPARAHNPSRFRDL